MHGHGRRGHHLHMNISVRHNDSDEADMHSQYGEAVYEHERVSGRAQIVTPCLQKAGTHMQSVMDCWHAALKEVGQSAARY